MMARVVASPIEASARRGKKPRSASVCCTDLTVAFTVDFAVEAVACLDVVSAVSVLILARPFAPSLMDPVVLPDGRLAPSRIWRSNSSPATPVTGRPRLFLYEEVGATVL